ncbi:MAG: GGDEF domain-containing protein [Hyphomicrobiales bacterium]|nr:GGDEF domain-containing protein [Hyphomicrobiales bacterium]
MPSPAAAILDTETLFVVAVLLTTMLGLLLLFMWKQDHFDALAWLGYSYLIGGFAVAYANAEWVVAPPLPHGIANALLFFACGMTWNASRLLHGRRVLWAEMSLGAAVWLGACAFAGFSHWSTGRAVLSAMIVAAYTVLTATELWRERSKLACGLWPAALMPCLYGAAFVVPVCLALLLPAERFASGLVGRWQSVLVIGVMLYVVGMAFVVLILAKEAAKQIHSDAAATDEMTGLLNRRGLLAAAQRLIERTGRRSQPVTVLMFDLDHFKSINDRFGHLVGDEVLRLFATTAGKQLHASDLIGRLGGEEFVAVLPAPIAEGAAAAERVRSAFETVAAAICGHDVGATVSIGVACGGPGTDIASLLIKSDAALYRAKAWGRNRVEIAEDVIPTIYTTAVGDISAVWSKSPRSGADATLVA